MESFIDTTGRKRNGVKVLCEYCKEEFATRSDQIRKYCSQKCRAKSQSKGIETDCAGCKSKFYKSPGRMNSKSGLYFCSRKCKDSSQRLGGIESIMPNHYGKSLSLRNSSYYRKQYKVLNNVKKLYCKRCNYSEFECGIDIHHVDGKSNNNTKENLISLCAPCHRALHGKLWILGS